MLADQVAGPVSVRFVLLESAGSRLTSRGIPRAGYSDGPHRTTEFRRAGTIEAADWRCSRLVLRINPLCRRCDGRSQPRFGGLDRSENSASYQLSYLNEQNGNDPVPALA
jgi:hypothetical protein